MASNSTHTPKLPQHDPKKDRIGTFFLDSGAHSLYTREILDPIRKLRASKDPADKKLLAEKMKDKYKYYRSQAFYDYIDEYATFIKENSKGIDYYVTVDAIFNPEVSWDVLKYMEKEHGLKPLPVIHYGAPMSSVRQHVEAGYEFIGLGGLGQEVKKDRYFAWAHKVYSVLCPAPTYKPIVRTHGFAMTAYELMVSFPWWSVDSASWCKAAGFGMVYIPTRNWKGEYTFFEVHRGVVNPVNPHNMKIGLEIKLKDAKCGVRFDAQMQARQKRQRLNVTGLSAGMLSALRDWLDDIEVPLGKVDKYGQIEEWGVISHYGARMLANLKFFEMLRTALPEWPWAYRPRPMKGFR